MPEFAHRRPVRRRPSPQIRPREPHLGGAAQSCVARQARRIIPPSQKVDGQHVQSTQRGSVTPIFLPTLSPISTPGPGPRTDDSGFCRFVLSQRPGESTTVDQPITLFSALSPQVGGQILQAQIAYDDGDGFVLVWALKQLKRGFQVRS